jgi:uncharacterized protein
LCEKHFLIGAEVDFVSAGNIGELNAMTDFTPIESLLGGVLIGLSAVVLMVSQGRIAGMTGIVAGLLPPVSSDWLWRFVFLGGAIAAPVVMGVFGFVPGFSVPVSNVSLIVGGLMVGIGVHFGGGCPSGHGVCGLSRFSVRSLVAVLVFMVAAGITVFVTRHMMGGL